MIRCRADPCPVDLGCDRALEQCHRHHDSQPVFHSLQNPLQAGQRPALDQYRLSHLQVRPRHHQKTRTDHSPDPLQFHLRNRHRRFPDPDQSDHSWSLQDRETVGNVEFTENVPREKRLVDHLNAVRPLPLRLKSGGILFVSDFSEIQRCRPLLVRPYTDGEPFATSSSSKI